MQTEERWWLGFEPTSRANQGNSDSKNYYTTKCPSLVTFRSPFFSYPEMTKEIIYSRKVCRLVWLRDPRMHFSDVFLPISSPVSSQVTTELLLVIYFFNHVIFLTKDNCCFKKKGPMMVTWDSVQLLNASSRSNPRFWKLFTLLMEFQLRQKKRNQKGSETLKIILI